MLEIVKSYIIIIIMLMSVIIFGKILIKRKSKINFKKQIILFMLISIIQTYVFINLNGTEKTVLMLFTNVILYKYLFDLSFTKSIFLAFIYMILLIIPDMIEMFFMTSILGMSKEYVYNYASGITSNLIVCLLLIIITFIIRKPLKKLVNADISNNFIIIILSLITLISILLFFYTLVRTFEFSNDIIQYLIAIIVLATVLFSLIRQIMENNKITKEYDKLLEFMTTYENEIEKQRILRHEAKNELLTIRAKICDNQENKEIVGYIDEILKEKIKVKQEEYAKFGYLPPNGIKGLCYFKVQEAEEKKIKVALNISKRIKSSTIFDLDTKHQKDFARILGVILDNAIEASLISKEKQIGIEAYMNNDKKFKMIISNTYSNNIDKSKIGNVKISTKGKNRGHGLLLVKHIINKNKIFELKTEIKNHIYVQTIIVKKV